MTVQYYGDISTCSYLVRQDNFTTDTPYTLISARRSDHENLEEWGFNTKLLDQDKMTSLLSDGDISYLQTIGLLQDSDGVFFPTANATTTTSNFFYKATYGNITIILMDLDKNATSLSLYEDSSMLNLLATVKFSSDELRESKFFIMTFSTSQGPYPLSLTIHELSDFPHINLFDEIISSSEFQLLSKSQIFVEMYGERWDARSYGLTGNIKLNHTLPTSVVNPITVTSGQVRVEGVLKHYLQI